MWTCTWLSGKSSSLEKPVFPHPSPPLSMMDRTQQPWGRVLHDSLKIRWFQLCLFTELLKKKKKKNQHLQCILTLYRIQIFFCVCVCMCASQILLSPLFIKIVIVLEPGAEGPRCLRVTVAFLLGNRIIFLNVANYNRRWVSFKREALCSSNVLL